MSILHSKETQVLIDRILRESEDLSWGLIETNKNFITHYYHSVPYDDLAERELTDLLGSASAHFELGRSRTPGVTKIRVYNPDPEQDGWQSKFSILEIVTDDRPFLVDSMSMLLNAMGLTIHLTVHPIFKIVRDDKDIAIKVGAFDAEMNGAISESFMQIQFDRCADSERLEEISERVESTIRNIESAYNDWREMRAKALQAAEDIASEKKRRKQDDSDDQVAFLRWIESENFTFLGYCELDYVGDDAMKLNEESLLGILHDESDVATVLPSEGFGFSAREESLMITKANTRSTIHRPTFMDLITIPMHNKKGGRTGLRVFLGLFASTAYNRSVLFIPLLRQKVNYVIVKSGLPQNSYDGRVMANIIDNYPRDNLFRTSDEDLFQDVVGIMELQERQRVRVFMQHDPYGRFSSVLVYIPRDRYNRELRIRIQEILMDSLQGTASQFDATFTESVLARISFIIHKAPESVQTLTDKQILESVEATTHNWSDRLSDAIDQRFSELQSASFRDKYQDAFTTGYQEDFAPRTAAADIRRMEQLNEENRTGVFFYRPLSDREDGVRLKIYSYGIPIPPSDSLPVLENMGLKVLAERPYRICPKDSEPIWMHDNMLVHADGHAIDPDKSRARFQEAFLRIWNGDAENDGFNRLILIAGLDWREVVVLRAYSRHLKQIGSQYSEAYMIKTLTLHPNMTARVIKLFKLMFDPTVEQQEERLKEHVQFVHSRLEVVMSLDEDVILRSFLNIIMSTLRTNFFQVDENDNPKEYLSLKIDPGLVLKMPEPRPAFEIFVYSPRVEGVHLRGGNVARGGLRWSDRLEDFRTEVLGLVKAQIVKNAVIVPVGSKGGFVIKRQITDRAELQKEVQECYRIFIRGLLDLTDNIVGGEIQHPANVIRNDDDDPYLVVAADKGTATFSDTANEISDHYGFWLGDAFASGGSAGYDHKGMGITAKGGWESVKRHFREMGTDIQNEDFTVVGIGDMGGDVFGNGMLLSEHIRLIGAFNHRHIFLDPNPDAAVSFKERKRLFETPGTGWDDYSQELISEGGGVFDRSAKAIDLTREVQELLAIEQDSLTPDALIRALLKAPVDLLWNGGIGTYVKASDQTHDDAADRTNDNLRVNAKELRCRVIGEGGNLGMTQLGRVEYSLNGGKCYTDFIDNSGGVSCSDHEVNIKILLNEVVNNGDMTVKQRNKLLEQMTESVSQRVLENNYEQSQAISIENTQALKLSGEHMRFIKELERSGDLNRELEFLPDNETLQERNKIGFGLTRPEISVLLAYAKMTLYQSLLKSQFPDGAYLRNDLVRYFPEVLSQNFSETMYEHRLQREIIATYATNNMVNRVGPTFAFRLHQLTGAKYPDIARAYTAAREIFGMRDFWIALEKLDNKIDSQLQTRMLIYAGGLIERASMWLIRHCEQPIDISAVVELYQTGARELFECLPEALAEHEAATMQAEKEDMIKKNVPEQVAQKVASFIPMSAALDIVEIATIADRPVQFVASVYFEIGAKMDLMWIRDQVAGLPTENLWHQLAKSRLRDDIHSQQYEITRDIVEKYELGDPKETVANWIEVKTFGYRRLSDLISELKTYANNDFATLSVAISEVHALRRAGGGISG